MTDRVQEDPGATAVRGDQKIDKAVALGSLALFAIGIAGIVTSVHALAAWGIFIFALFGFGSAVLTLFGYHGWRLVCFSPPLGLALVIIIGVLLVYLPIWSAGPALFWLLAAASASIHVRTLFKTRSRGRTSNGTDERNDDAASWRPDLLPNQRKLVWLEFVFIVVGLALCLTSAIAIRDLDPGWGGLLAAISPAWYVGLALIAAAIFFGQRLRGILIGLPVVALQLMLTATPAIVYHEPRYTWTATHVSVTQYILLHGTVNSSISIYQSWPGLFAGAAWLCRVSTFTSALAVAKWWSPVIDLATLLVVFQLAKRILRSSHQAWMAGAIFVLGYAIADADYFSPQSVGFLLGIATFAVVYRNRDDKTTMPPVGWFLLFAMSIADAVTHQLSPYMVAVALLVLVVFRQSVTKWAPFIALVPAMVWASIHYSYVAQQVSVHLLLNVFKNFLTPGLAQGGPPPGAVANLVRLFQGASALGVGALALIGLLRRRNIVNACVAVCAASAGTLVVVNPYGNEAAFRVVLFALPWLAILAGSLTFRARSWSAYLWPPLVFILLGTYLVADMGLDFVYAMRTGDVAAETKFELTAPIGSYLVVIGLPPSAPFDLTGRYNEVNETDTPDVVGDNLKKPLDAAASYAQFMVRFPTFIRTASSRVPGKHAEYYVLTAQQPAAYLAAYNYATLKQYAAFEKQFAESPAWQLVYQTSTAQLFRLRTLP